MIEMWMKNYLVSDNNCNIVNLQCPQKFHKDWQLNVGLPFIVSDTILWFTIGIEQDDLELVTLLCNIGIHLITLLNILMPR